MNSTRERHNAKARQSTAGQRKKGKRKASSSNIKEPEYDPNAEVIVPKSEEQKELDRRERLKQEVCTFDYGVCREIDQTLGQLLAQSESKVNSKKKKRLEKYIVSCMMQFQSC